MRARITNPQVAAVYQQYPVAVRKLLLELRKLIMDVAAHTAGVGELTETLKWNEPAYLTTQTKSGTTIRLGWKAATPEKYMMFVNCQTTLVDSYRSLFPELTFQGNRAVEFDATDVLPEDAVRVCIELALTYHIRRRQR